jgi:RNA polymerase sigma-70 factor (ECF subfamily)
VDVPATAERVVTRDFDSLVGPHIEAGYRLAVTMLLDPDEARDAVQEAAVKAWRSLKRLRDEEQVRSWFLSIVANQCRSTTRRHWWRLGRNELSQVGAGWREDDLVRSLDVAAAMRRLSPNDRAVLQLRFYFDLPLEEVARILGISAGAAKSRIYRAAARVGAQLSEEDVS